MYDAPVSWDILVPATILVRKSRWKPEKHLFAFFHQEGCDCLKSHILRLKTTRITFSQTLHKEPGLNA